MKAEELSWANFISQRVLLNLDETWFCSLAFHNFREPAEFPHPPLTSKPWHESCRSCSLSNLPLSQPVILNHCSFLPKWTAFVRNVSELAWPSEYKKKQVSIFWAWSLGRSGKIPFSNKIYRPHPKFSVSVAVQDSWLIKKTKAKQNSFLHVQARAWNCILLEAAVVILQTDLILQIK